MKRNGTRKCTQIHGWMLKRLTRKIKTASKRNKAHLSFIRKLIVDHKQPQIQCCAKDTKKKYSYFKNEKDFNKKQNKMNTVIRKRMKKYFKNVVKNTNKIIMN